MNANNKKKVEASVSDQRNARQTQRRPIRQTTMIEFVNLALERKMRAVCIENQPKETGF